MFITSDTYNFNNYFRSNSSVSVVGFIILMAWLNWLAVMNWFSHYKHWTAVISQVSSDEPGREAGRGSATGGTCLGGAPSGLSPHVSGVFRPSVRPRAPLPPLWRAPSMSALPPQHSTLPVLLLAQTRTEGTLFASQQPVRPATESLVEHQGGGWGREVPKDTGDGIPSGV